MHSFTVFSAVSLTLVAAFIVPRATKPDNWPTFLESWTTYHNRYLALGCEKKHDTSFFASCCHPLKTSQTTANLSSQCTPGNNVVVDGDGDGDGNGNDCDDDGDETTTQVPSHTSTKPAAPTTAVTSTHKVFIAPTPTKAPSTQSTAIFTNVTGGFITYFFQNGVAGACGTVHQDTDVVCALDSARYNNGQFCGKKIEIEANQRSIIVTVADECPTCNNANSIDLSVGAFQQITDLAVGILPATWTMLN